VTVAKDRGTKWWRGQSVTRYKPSPYFGSSAGGVKP
jgi:ribosomal protein L27